MTALTPAQQEQHIIGCKLDPESGEFWTEDTLESAVKLVSPLMSGELLVHQRLVHIHRRNPELSHSERELYLWGPLLPAV